VDGERKNRSRNERGRPQRGRPFGQRRVTQRGAFGKNREWTDEKTGRTNIKKQNRGAGTGSGFVVNVQGIQARAGTI